MPNVVANLHGLGVNALPVGVLGCDVAAEQVRTYLTEMGCSTDPLVEVSGRPTIEKTRVIAACFKFLGKLLYTLEGWKDGRSKTLGTEMEASTSNLPIFHPSNHKACQEVSETCPR